MSENVEGVRAGAKWGVLFVACIVAFLIAEVALRVFWDNPYGTNSTRMIVELSTPTKSLNRRIDRSAINQKKPIIAFRTDSRGYIEPARRFDQPDYTVAFLGGSTTECFFVDENMRFPARASFLLEQRGIRMNALNMGVSGNDVHQSVNNLLNYIVHDKPNVVVLMEAANDVGHLRAGGDYHAQMGQAPSSRTLARMAMTRVSAYSSVVALMRHANFLMHNRRTLEYVKARGTAPPPKKGPVPVEKYKQRLRAFIGVSRAFGITPVLMTQPSGVARNELTPFWVDPADQALFNEAVRDVAAEQKADLIDLVAFIGAHPKSSEPMFYDGIHVTDYGANVYAQYIAGRLQEIMTAPRQTTSS